MPTQPELKSIPLKRIRPDPTQSRATFDRASLEELAVSITQHGLMSPISVREVKSEERKEKDSLVAAPSSLFEIIAGERRYRAVSLMNWEEIFCFVYPEDTPEVETELLSLIENLQRVDLNPVEEARGFKQLIDSHGMTQGEVAKKVGKKQSAISEALALLALSPEVLQIIERSIISKGQARVLAKITNIDRQIALARQAADEGWTVRETERRVKEELQSPGAHDRAPAAAPPKPELDPLSPHWQNTRIRPDVETFGKWQVSYLGQSTWRFVLTLASKTPESAMARWFNWMGDLLSKVTRKEITDFATMVEFMPDTEAEFEKIANAKSRLPKTPEEQAELERLAEEGPQAVYRWIMGPDHLFTKKMAGKSWTDLGTPNSREGLKTVLEGVRMMSET